MKGRVPVGAKGMEVGNFIMGARNAIETMNIFQIVCLVGCNTGSWVSSEGMRQMLTELGIGKIKQAASHLEMAIKMIDNPHLDIYWAKGFQDQTLTPRQYVLNVIESRKAPEPAPKPVQQELFNERCEDIDAMKIVVSDLGHAVAELCDVLKRSLNPIKDYDRDVIGKIKLRTAKLIKEIA
jgi:hypothetical protein